MFLRNYYYYRLKMKDTKFYLYVCHVLLNNTGDAARSEACRVRQRMKGIHCICVMCSFLISPPTPRPSKPNVVVTLNAGVCCTVGSLFFHIPLPLFSVSFHGCPHTIESCSGSIFYPHLDPLCPGSCAPTSLPAQAGL